MTKAEITVMLHKKYSSVRGGLKDKERSYELRNAGSL